MTCVKATMWVLPLLNLLFLLMQCMQYDAQGHLNHCSLCFKSQLACTLLSLLSLQGVFIFFFHVVRHDKVWPKLTAKCRGKKYAVSSNTSSGTVRAVVYTMHTHSCS